MRIVQGNRLMVAASTNQIDSFQDVHGGWLAGRSTADGVKLPHEEAAI
jgi:hypothetical protein